MKHDFHFEPRAVAFLDVLGFKAVVEKTAQDDNQLYVLSSLVKTLDETVPHLNRTVDPSVDTALLPRHIAISDSIILSAPLTSPNNNAYSGVSTLMMRVIQITHQLLSEGYLIRGGLSVGSVHHDDHNIVGPAYQEAYALETKAVVPRVLISNTVFPHWPPHQQGNRMWLRYCGKCMVNGLFDGYVDASQGQSKLNTYKQYQRIVRKNLDSSLPESVRYKWWWFNEYLNHELDDNPLIQYD